MNHLLKICLKLKPGAPCTPKLHKLFSQSTLDINTNVVKDVILYKSNSERSFKVINLFGVVQFGFWNYLALTAYQTLKDVPVDKSHENVWWRKINFGDSKWRNSLTIVSFAIGWGILGVSWIYTLRAVKYVILRKGGKQATIVTYGPFGKNRMFTLDVNNISATQARSATTAFLPLKIKNHRLHYMVDMKGEFRNPILFDHTAGLKRTWQ